MSCTRIILGSCKPRVGSDVADRPFELALKARGCDVVACDWQDTSVDWSDCDAVFVRTTWTWTEDPTAFRQWIDRIAEATQVFSRPELLQWNLDKSYLCHFRNQGIAIVPSLFLDSIDITAIMNACIEWRTQKVVLKSSVGAGALSQHLIEADCDALAKLASQNFPRFGQVVVQPFLPTIHRSGETSAVFIDGQFSHAISKRPKDGDYRVQSEYGATHKPIQLDSVYAELAQRAVHSLTTLRLPSPKNHSIDAPDPSDFGSLAHDPSSRPDQFNNRGQLDERDIFSATPLHQPHQHEFKSHQSGSNLQNSTPNRSEQLKPKQTLPPKSDLPQECLSLNEPPLVVRIDMVEGLDGKPCLIEVEAVEPDLAWFADPSAADRLAERLLIKLRLKNF